MSVKSRGRTIEDQRELLKASMRARQGKEQQAVADLSFPSEGTTDLIDSPFWHKEVDVASVDLVKSKGYDGTARVSYPSQTLRLNVQSAEYSQVNRNEYETPSDRIGRFYNPSSAGLNMKTASRVAKAMVGRVPALIKSPAKTVLAPDATLAPTRISDMATFGSPSKPAKTISLPSNKTSAEASSSRINTVSRNKIIYPTTTTKNVIGNFDDWDPDVESTHLDVSLENLPRGTIIANMRKAISAVIDEGVMSAASKKVPLPTLSQKTVNRISARLALPLSLSSMVESVDDLLLSELRLVDTDFRYNAARAVVECSLRDPVEAKTLLVCSSKLADESAFQLWTNQEYQIYEWRVIRRTGVDAKVIAKVHRRARLRICTALPIMTSIQSVWMSVALPESCFEGLKTVNTLPLSQLLLTDINDVASRSRFPYTVTEFRVSIDNYSKSVHDGLSQFWLAEVGQKLHEYISSLSTTAGKVFVVNEDEEEFASQLGSSSMSSSIYKEESSSLATRASDDAVLLESLANKAMTNRMAIELSQSLPNTYGTGQRVFATGQIVATVAGVTKAEKILDSAALLLSLQVRNMCSDSLRSFAALFQKLRDPSTAEYSVFILNMRTRKLGTRDLSSDFSCPLEVCLQPSIEEVKSAVKESMQIILGASKGLSRPEIVYGRTGLFGGPNHAMVAGSLARNQNKKLNCGCITEDDELFIRLEDEINSSLDMFFKAPDALVQRFNEINQLLSGQLNDKVTALLEAPSTDPVDQLEILGYNCRELDALGKTIQDLVPDLSPFPAFEIKAADLKDSLIAHVRSLHAQIIDLVALDNREHMTSLCAQFQEIAETLDNPPINAAELKEYKAFFDETAKRIRQLEDDYKGICYDRVKFLLENKHKMSRDDQQTLYTTFNWPNNIDVYINNAYKQLTELKARFEDQLLADKMKLRDDIIDLTNEIQELAKRPASLQLFDKPCKDLKKWKDLIDILEARCNLITEQEVLLNVDQGEHQELLQIAVAELGPVELFWTTTREYQRRREEWVVLPLPEVDAEEMERAMDDYVRVATRLSKTFAEFEESLGTQGKKNAELLLKDMKDFQSQYVPLMLLVCTPGMQERHWRQIKKDTGEQVEVDLTVPVLNAQYLVVELGLNNFVSKIEDTCISAGKEFSLKINLDKMEAEWKTMDFATKEYRTPGYRVLSGIDEIQQLLDDQIVKIQAMRGSRYVKPFAERVSSWESILNSMQETLDTWLKVQAAWLYLEPIFSSEDIMRQMPVEGALFRAVNGIWKVAMDQTFEDPNCVHVARRQGFLPSLVEAKVKLESIQKALNDYLETKRLSFPRFFFLSNDELLEILAETKDPLKVQPHLKKCFDGIVKLDFQNPDKGMLDILGCFDSNDELEGERLNFPYEKVNQRMINPNESGGNVERWLIQVEVMMKKSLAFAIDIAMRAFMQEDRIDWLHDKQGQVIICINQTNWCMDVERTLVELGSGERSLRDYYDTLCNELMRTVELVRGNIKKKLRVAIGALVVMDVHNRDTVQEMSNLQVTSKTSFDWLSQLRYYWNEAGESAQSGLPGTVKCKMINATVDYAYEYIGNQDRLVITPLTDRCYRTLMGAIYLNLGGAPEGPAGTGKTETTKDLAKAIAIQCVVTNCSDGLDYLAMAKFFKGLASSGAWACFDEFNRIQLEVLSVIAQQIMQIQDAKRRCLEKFDFEGTNGLTLRPTCCPFITMNPGYAGRAELPDNLKVLFRTVAMMVPDYAMISEIILYSFGYTNAKPLSVKIVTTYKLCSEQLSSQSHYDYGMRAVIAVLRAAGNLRRTDGYLPEDVLVLRSIKDVNLPKFLSPDVPLFNGIVRDLFPGVNIDPPDRDNMKQAFQDACLSMKLIDEEYFWDKVVQIYDMMVVRHGFMVVGLPFSGKSSSWKVLAEVLGLLHKRFPDDKRWTKVVPIVQNPKSISMGHLYGQFDPVSHEWSDGILAVNYRNAANSKVGEAQDRKWMLFDGPVDAIWIENMNTVLDDNKKLCLMSGEIIAMTPEMSMMFEPMDLLVASPATVSRCGMIYLEPEQLGWQPLLKAWLATHLIGGAFYRDPIGDETVPVPLFETDVLLIQHLFDWLVDPCLCFVRKAMDEMSPTVDSNLVRSLLNIFESLLQKALLKYHLHGQYEYPEKDNDKTKRTQDIECCFLFSLVWSVGKSGTESSQIKFTKYLGQIIEDLDIIPSEYAVVHNALQLRAWIKPDFESSPYNATFLDIVPNHKFYDYIYDVEGSKWKQWTQLLQPNFTITPNKPFSSIIVPNVYTAQYNYMLKLLIFNRNNVLVCGPTGTGKSAYVNETISGDDFKERFKPLCLGFSAKTSALMTQDIIDGKLDKRRKGVYGPVIGQYCIIFVDDLNMPEVETYGAQPPIELLRQLLDSGGWYDLKERSWREIQDTSLVCAMGPAGGGRNSVTPRLLRHFNLLCFSEFDEPTLRRIFTTVVSWHFSSFFFAPEVSAMTDDIIHATLTTYKSVMENLLPTPQKSHYTFNLRDFSRVIQGVLLCRPSESFNKSAMVRLWTHESLRVFADRLVDDGDRKWFHEHIEKMCVSRFNIPFYDTFQHLDVEEIKEVSVDRMRGLLFGDFMSEGGGSSYEEIQSFNDLSVRMEECLAEFNQGNKKMDLVLFSFAIEHVARICRILRMPGGNSLLVGVGGSGRQSATRLATHICGYELKQIEISKNYTNIEWREDLKDVLRKAGNGNTPLTFLFSDTQIKNETFVEDISNILNSGEVPNIFPSDERAQVCDGARVHAKSVYGKAAADMTVQQLYTFFLGRVKQNLHIVLAFSPIGDAFRERLRKFPALINCCTINWFTTWPADALVAVARKFLMDVKFHDDDVRENIVALCQQFHIDVNELSDEFMSTLKRKNYVTPTSYLELILAFKQNLDKKRLEVAAAQKRYEVGLEKLAFAAEAVVQMQRTLNDLKPELDKSAKESDALRIQIEDKMPGVLATRKVVEAETAITQGETDRVLKQKEEVEADLRIAEPALDAAVAALDTINDKDISFIKNLQKPPDKIKTVCRAVCVMLQIPPVRIPDPDDPSKRIMDYWVPSQKMLTDVEFRNKLLTYNKDNIPPSVVAEIKKNYLDDPNFQPEVVESASSAAKGMCLWVRSLIIYDKVAKEVAPKKLALAEAQLALDISTGVLNEKKRAMQAVEDELSSLNADLNSAKQRKKELEDESDSCTTKIGRANDLLDGLGGERQRWGESADRLGEIYEKLTGDVLLSAGVLAYLGPFTAVFRQKQMAAWLASLKNFQIPCSDHPSLGSTLGDPVLIRKWNIEGLPTDQFSVDNGIIVFNARRWPLMIDPQGQANKWIRNMEKARELKTIKLTDANYLRTLENAITYGNPVLLENVGEELDPSLEPLLQKQIIKKGSGSYIKLGDTEVPYNADFRFYITTKLRNPHYLPEVSVKVTLLNFMITPEGLTDQLLGIVVSQERPDLEEQRNLLIVESAENKRRLKEIEDQILHIMSSSSGNILEDETAISTLKGSKAVSDEISKKQEIAERTEVDINNVRQSYAPIAYSSQILFFCITDLANIEPVYQYSLSWFINLFINSIKLSEKGRDVEKRLQNLDEHFTYSLYKNVCRSLLEKDKLLFSFLLTIRILKGKDAVDLEEWFFLLTGGTGMDNPHENPAPDWLTARCWDAVCRLSHMAKYSSFRADFVGHLREWRVIYDSLSPQDEIFPGIFSDATGLSRLCALRTIRPDKIVLAVQSFVLSTMGEAFVKPPIFDLEACYNDSSATVPLVFILSPGSDPMGAVRRAAESLHIHMDPISLGQGQGDKAKKMIENAKIKGEWVVLQNCHLAPSWMTTLEKIVEDLDPDTHPNFRIWCTTYPSDVFPVSVLQNGVKMTNEPPKGLRANLFGSFNADPINDDEFYSKCNKGFEFRRLIFGLCFFHALVQERRLYGPLGWNIPYEFNESDLKISIQQLQLFLDENDEVPYKALLYTAGECNYGGRVTDDKDRRTLLCILTRFYQADFLKEDYTITSTGAHQYKCPVDGNRQSYITFIESMPLIATPDVFGLHDNATLTKDQNDTNALLNSILDTEGGGSSAGGSSGSKDDMLSAVAADIASRLPSNFDIEMAQLKYPVRPDESMNTVLCQELIRFNNLLSLIRSSLKNIQKAVKGQVVMSSELEVLGNSLFVNRLPAMWKGKSFPSLKPLGSYVSDLHSRLQFFGEWLDHSAPSVFWISSFFFTQAFLTGSAQNFARKYIIPIDEIVFDFEMMRDEIHGTGPENGVYTQGLFIEGARWDKDIHVLTESLPKVLFAKSPTMHWIPMQKADVPVYHHYKCPVYKTSDRRGILATTGHSSNFVCFIHMPMSPADGEDHWIERGVAMLTQLDD